MLKITALGAHPDDIEIFMYGFLAAAQERGDHLTLFVATDGAKGGDNSAGNLASIREKEAIAGLAMLGMPHFLNLPDGGLEHAPGAGQLIADEITKAAPDLIITHAPHDYHPDHRALSHYVNAAAGFRCPVLFADTLMGVNFQPDYYVDITRHIDAKASAIMAHKSQMPHRFTEAMRITNRFRAAQCNAPADHYAEAYSLQSRFPFADIRELLPPPPPLRPFYVPNSDALI